MLISVFVACATSGADTSSDTADTANGGDTGNDEAPAVTWYFGTSSGQSPDGTQTSPKAELLFIRTLDRGASTIKEEFWNEDRGKWTPGELEEAVDVDAGTFTSEWVTEGGTLDVEGGFDQGKDWAWTAWHSTSTYRDGAKPGSYVTSEDTVDDKGVITANKSVFSAAAVENWQIVEHLTPTTQDEFETKLAEVTAE